MEKDSIDISRQIDKIAYDGIIDKDEAEKVAKIFNEKRYKQIIISKTSLNKLKDIIGSKSNKNYITDSDKKLIINFKDRKGTIHTELPSSEEIRKNNETSSALPPQGVSEVLPSKNETQTDSGDPYKEKYAVKKEFLQSDLLSKSVDFAKNVDKNMPQASSEFLDKYYTNSLVFAGNKKSLEIQSNSGGILNVWSHKYASQLVATAVFEGLPTSMNENFRYAIATMVATSTMYTKETFDKNITKEDIAIPFFYDLGNGNRIFFTYAPGGSISVDFKLNDIKSLNEKAGNYLRYVKGEIIQNYGDSIHKRDELRVDIGFGIQDGGDAHITSVKAPNNLSKYKYGDYSGSQVTIATYTDKILSAKVGANGESILKGTIGIQEDKTGITGIAGITSENNFRTDIGTFGTEVGVMGSNKIGGKIGANFTANNGINIGVSQTKDWLDPKTHLYTTGTKLTGGVPVGDMNVGATFLDGKASYNGVNYGEKGQVFGLNVGFDTKGGNSPMKQSIKDTIGGADVVVGINAGTDNSYGLDAKIQNNSGDANYGIGAHLGNKGESGVESSGNNFSAHIEKDILGLFDIFKDPKLNNEEKTKLLIDLKNKYNLEISENDIKKLGPISSLKAFAIANKDLIDDNTFMQLGFSVKGGAVILPKDFINPQDKEGSDFMAHSIIKFSVGARLGAVFSDGKISLGSEFFAKLDMLISEDRYFEYLAYKDWTKIINRLSYVENVSRDKNGTVLGFVVVVENQNGLMGAGAGINTIEKSGNGERFTIKLMQNGGVSVSWGNQGLVFGDTNTETSLNIGTLLPTISTIITENVGNNVTNENGETFGAYESLFQSIIKGPEDRKIVAQIGDKLNKLGNEVGFEFDDAFISKLSKTQNLKHFDEWLEKNIDFIINNKSKIRFIKLGTGSTEDTSYDDMSRILNYTIVLGNETKLLSENNLKAKQFDYYFFTEKPEEIKRKIKSSNTSVLDYIQASGDDFGEYKQYLLNCFKNIELVGFDNLSDVEKKGFIQLIIRFIKNGSIDTLKYKRISIKEDSLFTFSISIDNGIKGLNLEKQVLANIGESNLDYSKDLDFEKLGITKEDFHEMVKNLNKKELSRIIETLKDISTINIVSNHNVNLINEEGTRSFNKNISSQEIRNLPENRISFGSYISKNGKLYISSRLFEEMRSNKIPFKEILYIFSSARLNYLDDLDNEIKTGFSTNEAKIIRLKRGAGDNTFYEFRPTSDIINNDGAKKVKYSIFDHGNSKIDDFEVELDKGKNVFVTIQEKKYNLGDPEFTENYRHILYALTGMKGQTKDGNNKSIGGIISMF